MTPPTDQDPETYAIDPAEAEDPATDPDPKPATEKRTTLTEPDLTVLVVTLLKGVIYQESSPTMWSSLLKFQTRLRDYVSIMGLDLNLDEAEGYAFLRSRPSSEDDENEAPHLVARRQLSFPVSLILALLRKRLAESDTRGGDTRLIMNLDEIIEMVRIFFPAGSNDTKFVNQIEAQLNKIIDLGFLRKLKPSSSGEILYEVRRIIKAFVDAQWLAEFDEKLAKYEQYVAQSSGDSENG